MATNTTTVYKTRGGVPPKFVNDVLIALLRSPLHGVMSKRLIVLSFTGRKSGKRFTIPVGYKQDGDTITCFTHGTWWKNFQDQTPVTLHLKGRVLNGLGVAVNDDKQAIADGLTEMFREQPDTAKFYEVKMSADGEIPLDQVMRAAETTAMVRIQIMSK